MAGQDIDPQGDVESSARKRMKTGWVVQTRDFAIPREGGYTVYSTERGGKLDPPPWSRRHGRGLGVPLGWGVTGFRVLSDVEVLAFEVL